MPSNAYTTRSTYGKYLRKDEVLVRCNWRAKKGDLFTYLTKNFAME